MLNICTPQKLDVKYKRKRNSGVSWLKWQRVLPGGKSDDWNKGDEEVLSGCGVKERNAEVLCDLKEIQD